MTAVIIGSEPAQKELQQPLLSVVLPVFNGRSKIRKTIESLGEKLDSLRPQLCKLGGVGQEYNAYEIIVVNDGSTDDTEKVIRSAIAQSPAVRLVTYKVNMGKGYAIKEGVHASRGRYILFMDGDGEIGTDVLAKYIKSLSTSDIVIGSKNHRSSVVDAPASRKILSKLFQLFVRTLLNLKVRDTQVGLKAGDGDAFRRIFEHVTVNRYAFDAEMLAIATILGLRIKELPVKISLKKSFRQKDILRMGIDVIGIAYRLHIKKWYQKSLQPRSREHQDLSRPTAAVPA